MSFNLLRITIITILDLIRENFFFDERVQCFWLLNFFFPFVYIHIYVCVVIFHFLIPSIDLFALLFLFVSIEFFLIEVGGHHVRRTETLKLCVYVNKSSNTDGGSSLLVFLIYFWCEYKENERERGENFLFASLSIESIYAFYVLFLFYSISGTYILMAADFVCSSSFLFRYSNQSWEWILLKK
jgi:hypothetical protein